MSLNDDKAGSVSVIKVCVSFNPVLGRDQYYTVVDYTETGAGDSTFAGPAADSPEDALVALNHLFATGLTGMMRGFRALKDRDYALKINNVNASKQERPPSPDRGRVINIVEAMIKRAQKINTPD